MNERIKELASQVLDELVPETWTALKYDKIKEIQFRTAELIVKECAEIARLNTRVDSKVYLMIQEHFGVEE